MKITLTLGVWMALAATGSSTGRAAQTSRDGPLPPEVGMVGVNLACGEFGGTPAVFGRTYTYPKKSEFAYWAGKGLYVVRFPFKWQRVQKTLMGDLDETEMKRIDDSVASARAHGIRLLMDMHNYAKYGKNQIGTPEVPNEAFADAWRRLAERWKDEPAVFAYGIMNEPHQNNGLWKPAAQAAVDAIRSVDMRTAIFACGDGWSGAHSWKKINRDFILDDPANQLVYEAHQYFDHDHSGTYRRDYDGEGATPTCGVERLRPFADWLREHNARGFIGEFGVPDDDPRWIVVLENFTREMQACGIGGTYWAAGPWWGGYRLSVEPKGGEDRPQTAVLTRYAIAAPPETTTRVAARQPTPKPEAPKPRKATRVPIDGAVAEYDAMLRARLAEHLASGASADVFLSALGTRASVLAIDETGALRLSARGSEMNMNWQRLSLDDRRSLATNTAREGNEADHCIVAFYALACNDEQTAHEALTHCGNLASAVEGFFHVE